MNSITPARERVEAARAACAARYDAIAKRYLDAAAAVRGPDFWLRDAPWPYLHRDARTEEDALNTAVEALTVALRG